MGNKLTPSSTKCHAMLNRHSHGIAKLKTRPCAALLRRWWVPPGTGPTAHQNHSFRLVFKRSGFIEFSENRAFFTGNSD